MNVRYPWLAAVLALGCYGQTADTAAIHGTVDDQTRAPVLGVLVIATNTLTALERRATTDNAGHFTISGLPIAGTYTLLFSKAGFNVGSLEHLSFASGTRADIHLQLTAAGGSTEINVTGTIGTVRADEPQLGDRLGSREMQDIPLLDRKITYLPLLNAANRPAINQGDVFMNQDLFTTNGAGRRQTWFEVDGSNGVDLWGRQTIFTSIPLSAVQEMTVLENAFSAEYGSSAGGVVDIVTKSGGNRFHGEILDAWRPSAPEAKLSGFSASNASSGNDVTNDTLEQPAVSLSGPLGRDNRTQVFASGEYTIENRASPVVSPVAPGNFVGHYREWLGFLRLDHQFGDTNNLFLRSDVDGSRDTNPNGTVGGNTLPSVDRVFKKRTYSEEAGDTAILSPRLVNDLRLQFQLASPITQFSPVILGTQFQVPISTGGTFTSGTSQSALLLNRQYEASDTVTAVIGRHSLRFGEQVIASHNGGNSKEFGGPIYLGQFLYKSCTLPLSVCESQAYLHNIANVQSYTQSYGTSTYTVNDALLATFVQDDYRVRPDLTINFGLRYEQQRFTDSRLDFAPRFGFAYNFLGEGKTVIRGGYGIYHSQIVDNAEANYALGGPEGVFNYTATPGQVGFPTSTTAVPLPEFPTGSTAPVRSLYVRPGDPPYLNQFFPTAVLPGYPGHLLSPYSEQWSFGLEHQLGRNWVLGADYVGTRTLRINRPLDVDAPAPFVRTAPRQVRTAQAANCARPYWIWWYQSHGLTCNPLKASTPQPPYSVIQTDVNDGYASYESLNVNLAHHFTSRLSMLASYVWSHAIDNVDPDIPNQNPNDPNFTGQVENGNAIFDQRQRLVLSGVWRLPFKIDFGGVGTFGSGLPYNIVTGTVNSGDNGATTDRPVINGVVVGRNTGRGRPIYDVSPFLQREWPLGSEERRLTARAEAFNPLNHANFVGYSGTWGNGATPGPGFGQPLAGVTNQLPARSIQFELRLDF